MTDFAFARDTLDLPKGARARGWRNLLTADGRLVLGVTQGPWRNCLFPVATPRGVPVTSESPGDHPHHNSVWVASDHVHVRFPTNAPHDDLGTYNFYIDDIFQGRAPGTIRETAIDGSALPDGRFRIAQSLDWRGPGEWAAPEGRLFLRETRETVVAAEDTANVIDLRTTLTATDWDITLGPTRHALFGVRLADSLVLAGAGRLIDADGRDGERGVSGGRADWIDWSAPTPGAAGARAGIAIFRDRATDWSPWFATDWGTVAINPVGETALTVASGSSISFGMRLLAHDGLSAADIATSHARYLEEMT